MAADEDDLLGYYLKYIDGNGEHTFLPKSKKQLMGLQLMRAYGTVLVNTLQDWHKSKLMRLVIHGICLLKNLYFISQLEYHTICHIQILKTKKKYLDY